MHQKRIKTTIVILALVMIALAFFPPVSEEAKRKFRQQTIPAPFLEYGQTGEILKKLGVVVPVETFGDRADYHENVVDVIDRAKADRDKWVRVESFSAYREQGIFGYFEITSAEKQVPVVISAKVGRADWQRVKTFQLLPDKIVYPFFLDIDADRLQLDLFVRNREHPVTFSTVVFLQPGYQPLAFYDPISYRRLLQRSDRSGFSIGSNSFTLLPSDQGRHHKFPLAFKPEGISGISVFHKKQGRTTTEYAVGNKLISPADRTRDTGRLTEMSRTGLPVLAIDIRDEDLFSEDHGILKNVHGHGREWERIAHVRLVRDGVPVIDTFTGLRLQGGDPGREQGLINFRIFFREEYGESAIPGHLVFPGFDRMLKRVAVKQSEWEDWPLNSPIAYAVSSQIGALAPPTELITLQLNGESLGLYYLVPHLGETQVKRLFPEQELQYFRWRGPLHYTDRLFVYQEFWRRLQEIERLTESEADRYFDLDNLKAHINAIIFNGTGDFCQGLILKDSSPGSKMFWYLWDMDHSYVDVSTEIRTERPYQPRWRKTPDVLGFFKTEEQVPANCPRVHLFRRLVTEDHGFREKALVDLVTTLNHRLPDTYLTELLLIYWQQLERIDYPQRHLFFSRLSEFFRMRKTYLVENINELGFTAPLVECSVTSLHAPFSVAGYRQHDQYTGYHFVDQALEFLIEDVPESATVLVNGRPIDGHTVSYPVSRNEECRVWVDIRR